MAEATVLGLFAGVGSGTAARALGLEEEGVEKMPEARATRDAIGLKTVHDDVWTFDYAKTRYVGHKAGPPCQTFSTTGGGSGRRALDMVLQAITDGEWLWMDRMQELAERTDDRTALVLVPLHAWWMQRPEWVVWEQVPTVQPVWDACAEVMRASGYNVWTGKLHAEQYGVPQTRTRSVLIASGVREVGRPTPTHSRYYPQNPGRLDQGVKPWLSMSRATDWPWVARMVSNYGTGGDARNRGVREGWQPSPTVTSKIDRNKVEGRPVTVAEAGLLQSFAADTPWQGAKGKQFLQVGNAVPPGLAIPALGEASGLPWQDASEQYLQSIYKCDR